MLYRDLYMLTASLYTMIRTEGNPHSIIKSEFVSIRPKELDFPEITFAGFILDSGQNCPEIREKQVGLLDSAVEIIRNHNVKPSFYLLPDNKIALLLASALHFESTLEEGKSPKRLVRERIVASNFARTLFGAHSDTHPLEYDEEPEFLEDDQKLAVLQKYNDPQLSERFKSWVLTSEQLEETRKTLQIDKPEEVADFEVMVLSIGQQWHTQDMSKSPITSEKHNEYIDRLHKNGTQFMQDARFYCDALPRAFVCSIHGRNYMCIPEPTARIITEPESVGFKSDPDLEKTIYALVNHELTHTQGDLVLNTSGDQEKNKFGVSLEEYRAEVSSGKIFIDEYRCYLDTANAMQVLRFVLGIDIDDLMKSKPWAGVKDKTDFYLSLVNAIGLQNTAFITAHVDKEIIDETIPKSTKKLDKYLGDRKMEDEMLLRMTPDEKKRFFDRLIDENAKKYFIQKLKEIHEKLG